MKTVISYGLLGWVSVACAFYCYQIVYVLGQTVLARRLGLFAEVVSFGFGPKVFGWSAGRTKWLVSAVPTGGYTQFPDADYKQTSALSRGLIALTGPVTNLIGGYAALAWAESGGHYAPLIAAIGKLGIILCIFNLMPIPLLNGGFLVFLLIEAIRGKEISPSVKEASVKIGFVALIVVLIFGVRWLIRT